MLMLFVASALMLCLKFTVACSTNIRPFLARLLLPYWMRSLASRTGVSGELGFSAAEFKPLRLMVR